MQLDTNASSAGDAAGKWYADAAKITSQYSTGEKIPKQTVQKTVDDLNRLKEALKNTFGADQISNASNVLQTAANRVISYIEINDPKMSNLKEKCSKIAHEAASIGSGKIEKKSRSLASRLLGFRRGHKEIPENQGAAAPSVPPSPKDIIRSQLTIRNPELLKNIHLMSSREEQLAYIKQNLRDLIGDKDLRSFLDLVSSGVITGPDKIRLSGEEFLASEILHKIPTAQQKGTNIEHIWNGQVNRLCALYKNRHMQHLAPDFKDAWKATEDFEQQMGIASSEAKINPDAVIEQLAQSRAEQLEQTLISIRPIKARHIQALKIVTAILEGQPKTLNFYTPEEIHTAIDDFDLREDIFSIVPNLDSYLGKRVIRDEFEEFSKKGLGTEEDINIFFNNDPEAREYIKNADMFSKDGNIEVLVQFLARKGVKYSDLEKYRKNLDLELKNKNPTRDLEHLISRPVLNHDDALAYLRKFDRKTAK